MIDGLRHFYEHTASFSILRLRFLLRTTQLFSLSIHSERYGWLSLSLFPSLPPSLPLWNFPKMDLFSFPRGDTRRHLSGAHQTRQLPRFKSQTLIALKFEPEPHRNRTGTAPEPHRNRSGRARNPDSHLLWNFQWNTSSWAGAWNCDMTEVTPSEHLLNFYLASTKHLPTEGAGGAPTPVPGRCLQGRCVSTRVLGSRLWLEQINQGPIEAQPPSTWDLLETYLRPT